MHTAGTAGHHARWGPGRGAFLEAGAAIRTLVARLVTETKGTPRPRDHAQRSIPDLRRRT